MRAALIYMASGFGNRYGANKLLEELDGRPLYRHGLDCLLQVRETLERKGWRAQLLVVSQYEEILTEAARLGAEAVYNGSSSRGITASIRLGTRAAGQETELLAFFVADEPRLLQETVTGFLTGFGASGYGMGCVCAGDKRGNPAVFTARYREELMALTGDQGGSQLMKRHPGDLWLYQTPEEELRDVDLPGDLKRISDNDRG